MHFCVYYTVIYQLRVTFQLVVSHRVLRNYLFTAVIICASDGESKYSLNVVSVKKNKESKRRLNW